jgi:diguanylate cyclase (GGDEF)-like protein/PAS domain S-box-containing protein
MFDAKATYEKPPVLPDEEKRHDALLSYDILDTEAEEALDDLVKLASQVCGTPISLVTLVDRDRQWFKAKTNFDRTETPREVSFCGHAIAQAGLFMVPDATKDKRFAGNPLVVGDPHIRFYAGMPLESESGHNIGTLCVIDQAPKTLSPSQQEALRILAKQAMAQIELKKKMRLLNEAMADQRATEMSLQNSEERFRLFMDSGPLTVSIKDSQGRLVYYNKPFAKRFEITQHEWLGKDDFEIWPEDLAQEVRTGDLATLAGSQTVVSEHAVPVPGGALAYWRSFKFPVTDISGTRYVAGIGLDITKERVARELVKESEERFRDLFDTMQEMVQSIGPDGKFLFVNHAWRERMGYSEEEIPGLHVSEVIHPGEIERSKKIFELALHGQSFKNLPGRLVTKSGESLSVEADITWKFKDGKPVASRTIFRDVTERLERTRQIELYQKQLEDANSRLSQLAVTDALTGLKNRRAFEERLQEEGKRSSRSGLPLSLVMIDVDHFKQLNDSFGHLAGDTVLKRIAKLIIERARSTDLVCRFGGEEFAMLLPTTSVEGALVLAESLRSLIEHAGWERRAVTVSVGIATLHGLGAEKIEKLVERADRALYAAKKAGRNCVKQAN